jgi:hypothetical protein
MQYMYSGHRCLGWTFFASQDTTWALAMSKCIEEKATHWNERGIESNGKAFGKGLNGSERSNRWDDYRDPPKGRWGSWGSQTVWQILATCHLAHRMLRDVRLWLRLQTISRRRAWGQRCWLAFVGLRHSDTITIDIYIIYIILPISLDILVQLLRCQEQKSRFKFWRGGGDRKKAGSAQKGHVKMVKLWNLAMAAISWKTQKSHGKLRIHCISSPRFQWPGCRTGSW